MKLYSRLGQMKEMHLIAAWLFDRNCHVAKYVIKTTVNLSVRQIKGRQLMTFQNAGSLRKKRL